MSRHRFVRNIDLDAEMADEEEIDDSGMSPEEKAQMITSMPIARALLKDVKPPIPDDAIADSLWHYWFDVDKAVTWLRKDWERKGSPIPSHLVPTPSESPRPRPTKRARITRESSPQLPLTALQRLSLSRKDSASATPSSPIPSTPSTPTQENGKPMSKLALLAQKRKDAAQAAASASPSASSPSTTPLRSSTPSGDASSSTPTPKPLSKLAQKMAAAKLAREASSGSAPRQIPSSSRTLPIPISSGPEAEDEDMEEIIYNPPNSLFPSTSPTKTFRTSPFFNIITSTASSRTGSDAPPGSTSTMHLPIVRDIDKVEARIRSAFAAAESPDDVVLRARQGRAGTGALAPAITTALKRER